MKPYISNPPYIIKKRTPDYLHVGTWSACDAMLLLFVAMFYFAESYIFYIGTLFLLIFATYEIEWVIDRSKNEITRLRRVLWITIEDMSFSLSDIVRSEVRRKPSGEGYSFWKFVVVLKDREVVKIANTIKFKRLQPIVQDFRSYFPETASHIVPDDIEENDWLHL